MMELEVKPSGFAAQIGIVIIVNSKITISKVVFGHIMHTNATVGGLVLPISMVGKWKQPRVQIIVAYIKMLIILVPATNYFKGNSKEEFFQY
jgi:hypothetical protein